MCAHDYRFGLILFLFLVKGSKTLLAEAKKFLLDILVSFCDNLLAHFYEIIIHLDLLLS